jgi:hypothetical protein
VAALTLGLAASSALAASARFTSFLSRTPHGAGYNAPVTGYAVSQDQRYARFIALVSSATNVIGGRGGRFSDIFVIERAGSLANDGMPWRQGRTFAPIQTLDGRRPNGDSYAPSLDGGFYGDARCMAFISRATDLVPGNTHGVPQAYVEDLRSRRIRRVSVSSNGRAANGPVSAVAIDEDCTRVAFVADASNLALTSAGGAAAAVASRRARGSQAYVRIIGDSGWPAKPMNQGLVGTTFLASATAAGTPANGPVSDLAFANYGQQVGFTSTATNLDRGARSGQANVFETELGYGVGAIGSRPFQPIRRSVTLVSRTPSGREGNGPSNHPAIDVDGAYIAYHTDASDILPNDTNGVGDIVRATTFTHPMQQEWVSGPPGGNGDLPNAPSDFPTATWGAFIVEYQSYADNVATLGGDGQVSGIPSMLSWNQKNREIWLESQSPDGGPFQLPVTDPVTSYFGNYTLFTVDGQVWLRYAPK